MADAESGSQVEVTSVGEFVRLLKEREEKRRNLRGYGAPGGPVFVTQMTDRRPSSYQSPLIRRYVVAAFNDETGRVSYTRTTSNAVELPETGARIEERQRAAYQKVRAEIERGLKDSDLDVPMREGFLRHIADDGRVRRGGSG